MQSKIWYWPIYVTGQKLMCDIFKYLNLSYQPRLCKLRDKKFLWSEKILFFACCFFVFCRTCNKTTPSTCWTVMRFLSNEFFTINVYFKYAYKLCMSYLSTSSDLKNKINKYDYYDVLTVSHHQFFHFSFAFL